MCATRLIAAPETRELSSWVDCVATPCGVTAWKRGGLLDLEGSRACDVGGYVGWV
jgi:hypothetical protein